MKAALILQFIKSHYEDDPHAFFRAALAASEDFRESGKSALADMIDDILSRHCTVAPKKREAHNRGYSEEISFEDADKHYVIGDDPTLTFVPMSSLAPEGGGGDE